MTDRGAKEAGNLKQAAARESAGAESANTEERNDTDTSDELAKSESFENEMKALDDAGEDTVELRREYLLRRFWQAANGFWGKRGRRIAWILSAALLLIIILNVAASYAMNLWNRAIFDALEKKDANAVLFLSLLYFAILGASVCLGVAQVYARMTLQRRWRKWLTDNLVERWLSSGRYYQLNLVSGDHQNPNTGSPTTFGSRRSRRSTSSPALRQRSCRPRLLSRSCGPSAVRSISRSQACISTSPASW
jgi:ABC transporter transmembrane region 2